MEVKLADITPKGLREMPDAEVLNAHRRLHKLFKTKGINKEDVVNAKIFLLVEFKRRGFKHGRSDELDKAVEELTGKSVLIESGTVAWRRVVALWEAVEGFVYVPDFVSVSGSFIYHAEGRKPNDIDIIVRAPDRNPAVENALTDIIKGASGLSVHWVYEPRGPNWDSMPLFDLKVARTRRPSLVDGSNPADGVSWLSESHECRADREALLNLFAAVPGMITLAPGFVSVAGGFVESEEAPEPPELVVDRKSVV